MFFFDVSLPAIMAAVVILGAGLGGLWPALLTSPSDPAASEHDRDPGTLTSSNPNSAALFGSLVKLTAVALLLWLAPLPYFYFFSGDFAFWRTLSLFFTKTAFVTIGGSYTVIPYVAQVAVGKLHWLSQLQMTDGFALAETTPGPLIIVVAFVGFMAAYNHFQHSLWMGTLGLLLTTFYTFLPCFLFVFAGAPLVEHTHGKPALKGVLALITAVVVGAMLDLLFFLSRGVLFRTGAVTFWNIDFVAVGWVIASVVLLMRFRMNVVYVILLSIAFGLLRHQFGIR
jgi:chromate transporter